MDTYEAAADTEIVELTETEAIVQLNENMIQGQALISALIGMLIGFFALRELLKIWLE